MNLLREKFKASAIYVRFAPFFIFLILTAFQGGGGDSKYWAYIFKVFVGGWLVWEMRPFVTDS